MNKLRCGLIGYSLGWEQHGRRHGTYIQATDGLELGAVCDVNPDALAKATSDFPRVVTYSDFRELLRDASIDLVTVITPHYLHYPIARAALEAGKHVVVDKPFCFGVAEADDLFRLASLRQRKLTTFFNRRRDGNFLAISKMVASGEIGALREVRCTSEGRGLHGTNWRNSKSKSGGLLYEALGAHAVDWILLLLPARVTGVTGFAVPAETSDDANELHVRAFISFESGALADLTFSRLSLTGQPLWQIAGTKGTILDTGRDATKNYLYPFPAVADAPGAFTVKTLDGDQIRAREIPYAQSAWGTYYVDLARCIQAGGEPPVTVRDTRRVVAVMEAIERSARGGKSEPVDGE